MHAVILKTRRDLSLRRGHPWVFSGAIARVMGQPGPGDTVAVLSADGKPLGWGAYSPASQIRVRLWSTDTQHPIDEPFFQRRIARAAARRQGLSLEDQTDACRLVNAESDDLPGLIVDRYADFAVCQFLAAGVEAWKPAVVDALRRTLPLKGIFERSDPEVRGKEGLAPATGLLWGVAPPQPILIREGPLRFEVDVHRGHKTGFYLDQRDNRRLVAAYAAGAEVLNAFSYSGAFGVWALSGGARHVIQLDSAPDALAMADRHTRLNGLDPGRVTLVQADVFHQLRRFRDEDRRFDLIVLDPPKFAASSSQVSRAARGYKDINLLAFKLLRPGGRLFTFSCSGHIERPLFQKIVCDAALDAERSACILHHLGQAPDHPVALHFPEGEYLKGMAIQTD
jgi:23S rRNA (cytosine1962-C5)-methyltransferase